MFDNTITFIQSLYGSDQSVPLHEPTFCGNEKKYLCDAVDSTFVSSVGQYVDAFERAVADYLGVKYAVAVVNGTAAMHAALLVAGVGSEDEVITQPLTFVATCNAIKYCGANPIFIDVDRLTLGLSADALEEYLKKNAEVSSNRCINIKSGKTIRACVPMHTLGHPAEIDRIQLICQHYRIHLIEDAAESLGSLYKEKHTGTFGEIGVLSFNGNKTITCGGGGMIVTGSEALASHAKHLTTTAKLAHPWAYIHDEVGYNYRMPNINAALGLAQLENLPMFLNSKKSVARQYETYFSTISNVQFVKASKHSNPNFWLNGVVFESKDARDEFIQLSHHNRVYVRPLWELMHRLKMYMSESVFPNAEYIADRLVCLPSSPIIN